MTVAIGSLPIRVRLQTSIPSSFAKGIISVQKRESFTGSFAGTAS
jgi:hypothetical protein